MPAAIRAMRSETVPLTTPMPCLAAVHGGEALLELGDLGAVQLAPFAAAQRAQQALFLRLAEDRPGGERTSAERVLRRE